MDQITSGSYRGNAAGDNDIEKAASQLASDTKYEVRKALGPDVVSKMAPAALMKAYMEQLGKSEEGPVKALARKKLTGGSMKENFNIDALASSSVANALFKVFVEGAKKEETVLGEEYLEELIKKNRNGENLYWVKVYYKNGTTYTRWADRARMSEIRSNPNVETVEMVDSKPSEDQRDKSSKNDGNLANNYPPYNKVTRGDVVAGARGEDEMGGKKKIKEDLDFFAEGRGKDKKKKPFKFNVMRGKNDEIVKLFPETTKVNEEVITAKQKFMRMINEKAESEKQQKLFGLALSVKRGETPRSEVSAEVLKIVDTMSEKKIRDFAKTKHESLPVYKEETACDSSEPQRDTRGDYAKKNILKNKLRAAGIRNPIVMVTDEEDVKEGLGLSVVASRLGSAILSNKQTPYEQGAKNLQKNLTDPVGYAIKGAARAVLGPANNSPEAEKARRSKRLPEQIELDGEMVDEARAEEKRGFGSTGAQRQRQKTEIRGYNPVTSYSGGQNPQLRGKEGNSKENRRAASRRYVDQPGGIDAKPENKQGEGRYAGKQAKKRPDLGSRLD